MNLPFVAPHIDWVALLPLILVLGTGVVAVLVEAFVGHKARRATQLALTVLGLAAAFVVVAYQWLNYAGETLEGVVIFDSAYLLDRTALFMQASILLVGLISVLVVADRTETGQDAFTPQAAAIPGSPYERLAVQKGVVQTEVFPLLVFAIGGMMIFPAAGDLIIMFIALEILSLPLYIMSGMARRRRLLSQEAALKYFLLGAFASGFFLFGSALLYGFSGSVKLVNIAAALGTVTGMDALYITGVLLVVVGLLFKVAAAPFHQWSPDVYQGAPTPITGFMAAATKVAAFGALLRVMYLLTPHISDSLKPALWTITILSMVVGSVVALWQTDLKRILAYSSVAHAGFVLVGVVSLTPEALSAVQFYLFTYAVATVGAFALLTLVREKSADGVVLGEASSLDQWRGLGRKSPAVAITMAFFLISFAGIPLTSGFIAKFAVFTAAIAADATILAVLGVLSSAVAAFFYIRIIVMMFFSAPEGAEELDNTVVVRSEGLTTVVLWITVIVTFLLGVFPGPVLELVSQAAAFLA